MEFRIEWRRRMEGDDTLLTIENETNAVVKAWPADTDLLTNFLNDMTGLSQRPVEKSGNGVDHIDRQPQEFGDLVMSRSEDGDVLWLDPELYWDGIAHYFRSKGRDPHPYRSMG
jgi:hypothetical protein